MNSDRPNLDGSIATPSLSLARESQHRPRPYETSLISEYARFALLLVAVPLLIAYLQSYANHRVGMLAIVANGCLIASLLFSMGNSLLRLILLGCLTVNLAATMIHSVKLSGAIDLSINGNLNGALLCCLVAACFFEAAAAMQSVSRQTLLKLCAWGLLAIPVLIYVAGFPLLDAWQQASETDLPKRGLSDPNWNLLNEITFRAAKFLVFAAFTYLGACLGSFLNVVAASIPRGEPVAWRDSCCPQCNAKISRIDNLPIFSYINLGGRCRNCHSSIPIRYLLIECLVAGIFGSLFLYELVTGGANVPAVNCRHEGILWIILYPKWRIIGLVLLHASFMCFVLVLALIECNKQTFNRKLWAATSSAFFISMMLFLPLQPVPLLENLSVFANSFSPWLEQFIKLMTGTALGAMIGLSMNRVTLDEYSPFLTLAFVMAGMVLGWQALLQITLIFIPLFGALKLCARRIGLRKWGPTMVLLATILLHHPVWRMLASTWTLHD